LAIVLGQGRASRLYRNVRDEGLAHYVDASNYTPEDLGVFNVSLETTPDHVMPALRATADVLLAASATIQDAEIERAQTLTRTRLLRRLETVEGQANLLRSEEHTSELQSRENLVCRLLLEKKNMTLH